MNTRLYQVQVSCCLDCPAYRDRDEWCLLSNKPIPSDHDVFNGFPEFCELEEDVDVSPMEEVDYVASEGR